MAARHMHMQRCRLKDAIGCMMHPDHGSSDGHGIASDVGNDVMHLHRLLFHMNAVAW